MIYRMKNIEIQLDLVFSQNFQELLGFAPYLVSMHVMTFHASLTQNSKISTSKWSNDLLGLPDIKIRS